MSDSHPISANICSSSTALNQAIPNAPEPNGFSLWPLADFKPLAQEYAKDRISLPPFPGIHDYFAFADYLQRSWLYALALGGPNFDRVKIAGLKTPADVADNFSDFVELYLVDSPALDGPARERA